ncbi:hypothetical protein ACFL2F_03095 [Myxococcota bacterium]
MRYALILVSCFVFWAAADVYAQTLVITACKDTTGAKMGKNSRPVLHKALRQQGIRLIEYRVYLEAAEKAGVNKRQARTKNGIKKIAPLLKLDGAITNTAVQKGGRYMMAFFLYDPDGKLLFKKAYAMKKPTLPPKTAKKLAGLVAEALKGKPPEDPPSAAPKPAEEPELALVPLAPVPEKKPEVKPAEEPAPAPSPEDKKDWDKLLATKDKPEEEEEEEEETTPQAAAERSEAAPVGVPKTEPAPAVKPVATAKTTPTVLPPAPVTKRAVRLPKKPRKPGSVPDVLLAAGLSINTRGGLSPRHEASAFPGLRVDGRLFLGTFTNKVVLRDIGLEGVFNQSLGLQAEPELVDETWDASQLQWRAGLVYRLSFEDVTLAPAVLFHVGYGSTRYTIEYEHPEVLSASYTYTAGAVDIHLMPVRKLLYFYLSAGYLFSVWPSEKLDGDGSGFCLAAGVSLRLFQALHLSLGYEQVQFLFDDRQLGETSDQFQTFYLRAGWDLR